MRLIRASRTFGVSSASGMPMIDTESLMGRADAAAAALSALPVRAARMPSVDVTPLAGRDRVSLIFISRP